MISTGRKSEDFIDLTNINEADIAAYYFNIRSIPSLINNPLRRDTRPSLSLFSPNGKNIIWKDHGTGESGSIWTLLAKVWNCSYIDAIKRVYNEIGSNNLQITVSKSYRRPQINTSSQIDLQCKVRDWEKHDIEYWESYGISLRWLKYADVYPISHKIVIKDGISFAFKADKYAYAYVEFKEGRTTLKIYQPFNKNGFKWANRHDKSVISLWTKVPSFGERVCICSSLKDALCLWANTGIPSLSIQGEGYSISNTALNELKKRFKQIFICLDNDKTGLEDAEKLASKTGFINIVLPQFDGGKDISDLFKVLQNKEQFKQIILDLFNYGQKKSLSGN